MPQETSILSNLTDEGLDLSQRISESIFQGPELDTEGEELLTGNVTQGRGGGTCHSESVRVYSRGQN